MRTPIFIRPVTEDEQHQIQAGLRSRDAFVLRRCQMVSACARLERVPQIARQVGCDDQVVRNVIHGFNTAGLDVLRQGSSRPHRLRTSFTEEGLERLQDLLHRSPREFGKERGTWTPGTGRPGVFGARHHRGANFRRERAPCPQTAENPLEACQTLDYQSRPAIPEKKPLATDC